MRELQTYTAEEILTTVYKPIEFIIEGLLAQGLYILAGAQKIGKSWLALDICLSVATGTDVLQRKTVQGTVLYFCLEDNYNRIQDRLYKMNAAETECLYFTVASERIGSGLEEQIVSFAKAHSDLKLVVIDVMQLIRSETESSYGSDYADMAVLKQLADSLGITIVLIHHTRKFKDSDPFNMISGSSGLSGCADGSFVLVETRRGSHKATLFCVGRDIESAEIQMHLDTDTMRWTVDDEPTQKKMHSNIFLSAVYVFICARKTFIGTPSELVDALKTVTDIEFFPNRVARDLVQNGYSLALCGIRFDTKRTHRGRVIELQYDAEHDSSDCKNGADEVTVTRRLLGA